MKRIAVLFPLLLLSLMLNGQSWAPAGATWHYTYSQMMSYGYIEIKYVNDTIIQSNNCKVLQKTAYGYSYPGVYDTTVIGNEYTHFDSLNNIVYRYFDGSFDTLYYFNAQPGDTWKVMGLLNFPDSGRVIVDSTGFEIINSDTLKSIYVSAINGSCVGWYSGKIVEKIGCITDYMFPNYISCVMDVSEGGPLRCYSDDNFPLFSTGQAVSCDFITSANDFTTQNEQFIIYPVPASKCIAIENNNLMNKNILIEVYTLQGEKIFKENTLYNNKFQIDISGLNSGLYFLKITNDKGILFSKKFVKE